jgi:hypothetical protein
MTIASDKAHFLSAIDGFEIHEYPFLNFYASDILTTDLYQNLAVSWPTVEQSVPMAETGIMRPRTRESNCTNMLRLLPRMGTEGAVGPDVSNPFWGRFSALLTDRDIVQRMVSLAKPYIREFRSDLSRRMTIGSEFLVQSDLQGFFLGPHVDTPRKLLSLVFYFAEDDQPKTLGTSMFKPNETMRARRPEVCRKFIGGYHDTDGFDVVSTVEYRPNCLFGHIVTPHAFHGVLEMENLTKPRRTILWDITQTPC